MPITESGPADTTTLEGLLPVLLYSLSDPSQLRGQRGPWARTSGGGRRLLPCFLMPELFEQCGWTRPLLPPAVSAGAGGHAPGPSAGRLSDGGWTADGPPLRGGGGPAQRVFFAQYYRGAQGGPGGSWISRRFHKNMRQSKKWHSHFSTVSFLRYIPQGTSLALFGAIHLVPRK